MRNCRIAVAGIVVMSLSACETSGPIRQAPPFSKTAAEKALGPPAFSTRLLAANALRPGRIYHIKPTGEIYQICERDFDPINGQNALKAVSAAETENTDNTVEDTISVSGRLQFGGVTANTPGDRVKAIGFVVKEAKTPSDDGNAAGYILSNLAEQCRETVLPRNRPYYVVTAIATAKKAEVYSRPLLEGGIGLGPAGINFGSGEVMSEQRSNVIFGFKADARR